MATDRRQTYDEIVARTVPDPDSSFRPSPEQERDTRDGVVLPDDQEALAARVTAALEAAGFSGVGVEVSGARVVLRGAVRDTGALNQIESTVSTVEGVSAIDNRLHIAPGR